MDDIKIRDADGFHYSIDVKTHRSETRIRERLSMPNITNVKRLIDYYEDDSNVFALLIVRYQIRDNKVEPIDVRTFPVEFLDWNCIRIGALGWG